MAYRKFSRRPSFRRAPRRGVRTITEPKRWEAANFFFADTLTASAVNFDVVFWDVMHVGHFDNYGAGDRQIPDAIRSMEIGGIVWDTCVSRIVGNATAPASGTEFLLHEWLVTDRMSALYDPVSLATFDATTTQSPIAGTPTGGTDGDFPIRIHKRRFYAGNAPIPANELSSAVPARYPVFSNTWGTQKVRLKGGLGDRNGLFLIHQLTNLNGNAGNLGCNINVSGTLYYRIKF